MGLTRVRPSKSVCASDPSWNTKHGAMPKLFWPKWTLILASWTKTAGKGNILSHMCLNPMHPRWIYSNSQAPNNWLRVCWMGSLQLYSHRAKLAVGRHLPCKVTSHRKMAAWTRWATAGESCPAPLTPSFPWLDSGRKNRTSKRVRWKFTTRISRIYWTHLRACCSADSTPKEVSRWMTCWW